MKIIFIFSAAYSFVLLVDHSWCLVYYKLFCFSYMLLVAWISRFSSCDVVLSEPYREFVIEFKKHKDFYIYISILISEYYIGVRVAHMFYVACVNALSSNGLLPVKNI